MWLCSHAAIHPENTNWHYVALHGLMQSQKFNSTVAFLKSMSQVQTVYRLSKLADIWGKP